jgi:multidrug resistance efflux pump
LQAAIASTEAELQKAQAVLPGPTEADFLKQELVLIKERLAWEEKMVAKGFMSEAQVKRTRLDVARAEAALAEAVAPPAPNPRRAAMETTVQKLEQIVQQTRQGVERGIVPLRDLLDSEATLARYKLELAELDDRLPTGRPGVSSARRAAMEALIQKVEEIAKVTEEGFKKGIIPQQELLNAQKTVLEYRYKLLELDDAAAADPRAATPAVPPPARLEAEIDHKKSELDRAEALVKQNVISLEEVRRQRIDLARLRARAATAGGDFAAALKHREDVVAELDAQVTSVRALVERKVAPQSELRAIGVALAEARIEALRAGVRRQLADIVCARETELKEVRTLFDAKVTSAEEVRRAETALADARARLVGER